MIRVKEYKTCCSVTPDLCIWRYWCILLRLTFIR